MEGTDRLLTKDNLIQSFEIVTLKESGMRFVMEYEIVMKNGQAEISRYGIRFQQQEQRTLELQCLCSAEDVLKLLNDCCLLSWDGFVGPHPDGVLDGIMFRLHAAVNQGKQICASGSENFPKHYWDFTNGLYELLHKGS